VRLSDDDFLAAATSVRARKNPKDAAALRSDEGTGRRAGEALGLRVLEPDLRTGRIRRLDRSAS